MAKRLEYLPVLILIVIQACSGPQAPMHPDYSTMVVIEAEAWRSANAEIADIDGDGYTDIILAIGRHWPGPNLLFPGNGSGEFVKADTLPGPQDRSYSITAADMDADGDIDLVVSNDRPDPKYVMLNDGQGDFSQRVEFGDPEWPTRNSTIADVNMDGRPDIIVANRDATPEGNNFVCLNESGALLALSCHSIRSGSATTITVADINNDGYPDLIVPYRDVGQSHVYLGDGSGRFEERIPFGPSDASLRSAIALDLNGDDRLDIVTIDDRKNETRVYLQEEGGFEAGRRIDNGIRPYALDQADLNGDGREDILVGYHNAPSRIYFNATDSLISVAFGDSAGTAYGFGVGDVNQDGIQDIAVARSDASDVLFMGTTQPDGQ